MNSTKIPIRYLPKNLSRKDKKKQAQMLLKSRRLYKQGKYYTRKQLPSYPHKVSQHIRNAQRIYGIEKITPSRELARATGCSINALSQIVRKGEGAYFSSGSRPNQTGQSWGLARLASSITGGRAAVVDFDILDKGCDHQKRAYILAKQSRKKYGTKLSQTRKTRLRA